jgi:hypothetical protein
MLVAAALKGAPGSGAAILFVRPVDLVCVAALHPDQFEPDDRGIARDKFLDRCHDLEFVRLWIIGAASCVTSSSEEPGAVGFALVASKSTSKVRL